MDNKPKPAVLVISSQVVRGAVGGRAAVFALERLGFPVWFLPTVLLPWHPGHGASNRLTVPGDSFAGMVDDLLNSAWLPEIRGILTGYLGDSSQAAPVAALIRAIKEANPETLYLCDPVLGDGEDGEGSLYVPETTAAAVREVLLPLADVATPNLFELAWLSGRPVSDAMACVEASRALGPGRVIATSVPAFKRGCVANLLTQGKQAILAEHAGLSAVPHGTGDLLAALALAGLLEGSAGKRLLRRITASVGDIVGLSAAHNSDELMLSHAQGSLIRPRASVSVRHIGERRHA